MKIKIETRKIESVVTEYEYKFPMYRFYDENRVGMLRITHHRDEWAQWLECVTVWMRPDVTIKRWKVAIDADGMIGRHESPNLPELLKSYPVPATSTDFDGFVSATLREAGWMDAMQEETRELENYINHLEDKLDENGFGGFSRAKWAQNGL